MIVSIQLRRDTAADWSADNPILKSGEVGVETDTSRAKLGDGSTSWNNLGYWETSPGGGSDKNYVQTFATTATVSVSHNLGKYPAVTVMDSSGDQVVGDVVYTDLNNLIVSFSAPFSGTVTCN